MPNNQMTLARVRGFTSAFNDHDIAALLTHVAADVIVSRGDGTTLDGHSALTELLQGLFAAYPDSRLAPLRMVGFGDGAVAAEWTLSGTQLSGLDLPCSGMSAALSGRSVEIACAALIFFDAAGVMSRIEFRGDTAALLAEADAPAGAEVSAEAIRDMAQSYAAAWCSGDPAAVGSHYAESGWISINGGVPFSGRAGVTGMAAGFMEAFPGVELTMDDLQISGDQVVFSWTLKGANSGSGGTGQRVAISGFEIWRIDADCRVAESHGYFDNAAYAYQLQHGPVSQ